MLRKAAPAASMQKTYDECYLICSTAIYFEGQNNEAEALRSWRNALDQIYYHNAYRVPSGFMPRSETEKALQDSLRAMELQCKERVDLLDALRRSRIEAEQEAKEAKGYGDAPSKSKESLASVKAAPRQAPPPYSTSNASAAGPSWLGGDTIPQTTYADIPRPSPTPERRPPQPKRPSYARKRSSEIETPRTMSLQSITSPNLTPPIAQQGRGRTPSPEKKSGGMLKTLRANPKERATSSSLLNSSMRNKPPNAASKAATQSWTTQPQRASGSSTLANNAGSSAPPPQSPGPATWDPYTRSLVERPARQNATDRSASDIIRPPSPSDYLQPKHSNPSLQDIGKSRSYPAPYPGYSVPNAYSRPFAHSDESLETVKPLQPAPPPPPHREPPQSPPNDKSGPVHPAVRPLGQTSLSYMKEYPNHPPMKPREPPPVPAKYADRTERASDADNATRTVSPRTVQSQANQAIPRKAVSRAVGVASATSERQKLDSTQSRLEDRAGGELYRNKATYTNSGPEPLLKKSSKRRVQPKATSSRNLTPPSSADEAPDVDHPSTPTEQQQWDKRVEELSKNLPRGVDEAAAKAIFNDIVIQGDEVHWDDVAGLEIAKSALKETVVYPFLRPDLFMGLREPARGMLLFGPPGTGKTMLARAVATESKSVFFAISASSLTSKYLGESEKLVRALFSLAKALAPSIIFVDEIDSLLGSRGGSSEHEATRRIKTEFLIQWSDLQKAAAGREDKDRGDATRVLVLAATNLPWAIDEAARRRFVRRQYIPLPEDWVREKQLRNLLSAQNHNIRDRDLKSLVRLTEGYSGSDITALAKDAAMGPLRSLGERLLDMSPDEIRPIGMGDFEKSLINIRPSVNSAGLKEFEEWAREFGERGG
ncbi:hypothetical protein LTR62_002591 [Meristemomyces frigidus]|uniref:AAA+ ATPase domain-containing protein n=1 Tax=Meristemomyces frigidus TaxID=1508187 RepID=A0AAN7TKT2_9PEZI|nr:hypothetical protein LTR62_002591 [Meristemomyces frigidus]